MEPTRSRRPLTNATASAGAVRLSVQPTVPALTPAQMYSNFEEWIKMCTDNKVNATNTWSFELIDYFHEMTFIREGDSINFQKASCTLDGCVKIYTSRVDSVATETGKLLSGLADSSHVDEDEPRQTSERRIRRKTQRSEATLLKDFSSIALKKFDLDFAVDPLFKKTSADFDEGGARGLLLNHLGIDKHCKIIFDASDATVDCELEELEDEHTTIDHIEHQPHKETNTMNEQEKEEHSEQKEEEEEKDDPMEIDKQVDKQEEPRVEIFRLKAKLPKMEALSDFHIVPFLKDYDFFSETDNSIPDLDLDEEDEEVLPMDDIPQEDNFQFDDFDYGVDDMDPFEDENTQFPKTEPELDFTKESKPHEDDFLSAFISNGNNEMFDYFDSTFSKNWAGLGHWKLKKPIKRTKPVENNDKPAQKKKTRADQFRLAFDEVEEEGPDDQIFEHYTKRPTMSKEITAKMTGHSLPDDINFSSKLLLQYALKPALYFKKTKHKKLIEQENTDIDFWADQTQDFMDEPDYTNDDFDMPIDDTQLDTKYDDASFYHDNDENDPEMSELYGDELITNHTLKKTRPLYVNYARTAKRVDVKKLKDNLWKVLTQEQEKVSGEQKFTDIVHHLKKMYPPKTMRDISVPFCFICLLHLANEKDLSIQGPIHNDDDDDDFVLGEQAWMNNESILNEVTIIQN